MLTTALVNVSRRDPLIARIIASTYPDYTGRKIRLTAAERVTMRDNFWSEGSRSYYWFVDLNTAGASGKLHAVRAIELPTQNPLLDAAEHASDIPPGFACVRRTFTQGHDCGLTILAHPSNVATLLPAVNR